MPKFTPSGAIRGKLWMMHSERAYTLFMEKVGLSVAEIDVLDHGRVEKLLFLLGTSRLRVPDEELEGYITAFAADFKAIYDQHLLSDPMSPAFLQRCVDHCVNGQAFAWMTNHHAGLRWPTQ